jgi:hypothetical protein
LAMPLRGGAESSSCRIVITVVQRITVTALTRTGPLRGAARRGRVQRVTVHSERSPSLSTTPTTTSCPSRFAHYHHDAFRKRFRRGPTQANPSARVRVGLNTIPGCHNAAHHGPSTSAEVRPRRWESEFETYGRAYSGRLSRYRDSRDASNSPPRRQWR